MEEITSRSNARVKAAAQLLSSAAARREEGLFVLEGARLCMDAGQTGIPLRQLFLTRQALERYPKETAFLKERAASVFLITEEISRRLGDTQSPQGICCICEVLDKSPGDDTIEKNGSYIALENIQDPSNLGAVARTAEALGLSGLIVSGGCDLYSPKAQRAAMGSLLRVPVLRMDSMEAALHACRAQGMRLFASTPRVDALPVAEAGLGPRTVCVVGNEGAGVTRETMALCDALVTIPMSGRAESLNASAAAAILMWEMMRER